MPKRGTNWDDDDTFGSDILGTGAAWGEMRGKVKTKQIGFIRNEGKRKIKGASKPQSNANKRSPSN